MAQLGLIGELHAPVDLGFLSDAIVLLRFFEAGGEIRKMVAMDGHEGPKEIHVQPEFFNWLTDPVKNGAGAMFDFGCYGANLMTWMMDNQRPVKVTAIAQTNKPQIYPRVDDEATILVEYPKAQGIIQASWNWPFSRKDFEVYAERANEMRENIFNLRIRHAAGTLDSSSDLGKHRRDLARVLTVLNQKKRAAPLPAASAEKKA